LIKIDVQGAEMMVLEGADVILRTSRPALFVELHEASLKNFDTSVAEILGHLARYGYQSYWLSGTGTHQRATAEDIHARVAQAGYVDALFLKAG
jgi:hypothetical protein